MKTIFETETCSRCGGSGHYSYCQMYGTVCFGCSGRKLRLTKRGAAAFAYYTQLCSLPLERLEVGMEIWNDNFFGKSGWGKILDIRPDKLNAGMTTVETERLSHGVYAGNVFRVRQSPEQVRAKQALAIEFERSLDKSGKPSKSLAKLMTQVAYA